MILNYRKEEEEAQKTLEMLRAVGGYGALYRADLRSFEEAQGLVAFAVAKTGRLDVLINNAGVSHHGLLMDMSEETYDWIMDTNLKGAFNVTRHALPHLLRTQGSILTISSIWSAHGAANEVVYAMSKAGLNAFTKSLAKEVGPMGVRVNAVAPGLIDTQMNDRLSAKEKEAMVCSLASHRMGTGEDIAKACVFLLSEEAAYINGQIITIDGGLL